MPGLIIYQPVLELFFKMKRKKIHLILIYFFAGIFLILINSCAKDSFNECLSGVGAASIERRAMYAFKNIAVYDNINLNIVQGDIYEVKIEAGEKLIPMITTRIESGKLTIRNESTCPLLKDPWKGVTVTLTIPEFDTLEIYNHGNITCSDSLKMEDANLLISGSSGKIDLTFKVTNLSVAYKGGVSEVFIRGLARMGRFYSAAYGPMDCTDFWSKFMIINSNSTNNCYINSGEQILDVVISDIGNIYYHGTPLYLYTDFQSTGRLIKLD